MTTIHGALVDQQPLYLFHVLQGVHPHVLVICENEDNVWPPRGILGVSTADTEQQAQLDQIKKGGHGS